MTLCVGDHTQVSTVEYITIMLPIKPLPLLKTLHTIYMQRQQELLHIIISIVKHNKWTLLLSISQNLLHVYKLGLAQSCASFFFVMSCAVVFGYKDTMLLPFTCMK